MIIEMHLAAGADIAKHNYSKDSPLRWAAAHIHTLSFACRVFGPWRPEYLINEYGAGGNPEVRRRSFVRSSFRQFRLLFLVVGGGWLLATEKLCLLLPYEQVSDRARPPHGVICIVYHF